jgi:hypothetical protein
MLMLNSELQTNTGMRNLAKGLYGLTSNKSGYTAIEQ